MAKPAIEKIEPSEPLPTADDWRLLDELDGFNEKIAAAITYLRSRGHGEHLIRWMLEQHEALVASGGKIRPLVMHVVLEVDQRTDGKRRAEIAAALVEGGAMKVADPDTLRKKLSDGRKKDSVAPRERPTPVDFLVHTGLAAKYPEMLPSRARELLQADRENIERLAELDLVAAWPDRGAGPIYKLHESLEELASELDSDS